MGDSQGAPPELFERFSMRFRIQEDEEAFREHYTRHYPATLQIAGLALGFFLLVRGAVNHHAEWSRDDRPFRWEAEDGSTERTLHRTDGLVGMGVAQSFRIGEAMSYRISLGARIIAARRPFPEGDTEPRQRCGTCVDRGYSIAGSMSFDF